MTLRARTIWQVRECALTLVLAITLPVRALALFLVLSIRIPQRNAYIIILLLQIPVPVCGAAMRTDEIKFFLHI
jgi:hypothetical protein